MSSPLVVSVDLIYGAPGETVQQWERDLQTLLAYRPQHVSIYALTYERGTRFWALRRKGILQEAPEEVQAAMY